MQKQSSSSSNANGNATEKKSSNNNKKLQQIDKQFYSEFLSFQYDKEDDEEYTLSYRPKIKSKRFQKQEREQREGLYIRAKFRFITSQDQVSDTSIYSPLKQLSWEKIIQVIFPTQKGEITCPICMNDQHQIIAPQITPCGHIYCYYCYLRHDDISDTKNYCPLCGEFAPNCDLKSAKIVEYETCKDQISFQLLMRQENEQIVYRADTLSEDPQFSKIMIAKPQYIVNDILKKERDELNNFLLECISSQETWNIPYIEQALKINQQKSEKYEKLILQEEQQRVYDQVKLKKKSSKQQSNESSGQQQQSSDETNFFFKQLTQQQIKKSQIHYFYQEKNGQLIFLNPINNKYLFEEFNKENKLPLHEITTKLISLQNSCADQNLLKRYPYLKHLPPYSDILLAEVDMNGLINPENVKKNDAELAAIHQKVKEKEERELKKMQKNRKMSDNPYGQFYDREQYLQYGLITFPPQKMPTEEKHYPTLQQSQSLPQQIQVDEEQKQQIEKSRKKEDFEDGEDDYVIMSKNGQLPTNYVDKQSRQKIKQMQNETYFPSLGGLQSIPEKTQQSKKKSSSEIHVDNNKVNSELVNQQTQNQEQINEINNQEINIQLQKQNELKQVIVDEKNNVIIDGDQIYDQWNQEQILQNAKQKSTNNQDTTAEGNKKHGNKNKKQNKKVVIDGNFFF
ncbi:zinc finger, C3HC4 type (RING finger) protein (macronuclear) [Tetrahymena thermophila SB210]|uniref:Zinc finger, C3HC4 type (RING finger) protein n=1 Tax=Tetrahymena thermophila (strain SB210) TaxID=312017 RepID=I7MDM4_TETTS|nr:zinc finger, C3HC4 type (RING finger) protein [Tetrahymena thermophila SB210]EAR89882.4 zinc finger, C3HC4 type (RING finger) protein [Tetrahymena thermophila SB210]|eukprot:XP_001010127.4 zinc finger, C3HC4 type (RING finger) protein [Tetrahymena thermophila SB210]